MPTLKEIRESMANAVKAMRDIDGKATAEKRDMSAEERQQWDRASAEYDRLKGERERSERLERVEADQGRGAGDPDAGRDGRPPRREKGKGDRVAATEEQRSLAFRAWAKSQYGCELNRREREACRALRFNPNSKQVRIGLASDAYRGELKARARQVHPDRRGEFYQSERRAAMSAQVGTSGAYLVSPGSLSAAFELNLLAYGGVRQVAEEITTQSGEPFLWPTVDDTANQGEQLGENTSVGTGTNPAFGMRRWDAYKFSSKPVLIPTELLDDDQYQIDARIGELLGIRLGRVTGSKYATGSGAGTPSGIVTDAGLGVTAASATAIKTDEILELIHSIDPAYRGMPGNGFLLHDSIVLALRKLKDGEGRYIWTPGLDSGAPDKMLGYPINVCQEMASTVEASAKVLLFGCLSQYKIRRVRDVRMYRLVERYRDQDQDGFVAFIREDGKLLNAGTNPVKYLQMHA